MRETDVLIIGGGLTGLSCARELEKSGMRNYLLIEKMPRVGGLSGSMIKDGFTFDYSGHLLHLHDPEIKKVMLGLLGKNLSLIKRNSLVYSHKTYTPYPFQANTYGLPFKVISECVSEFLKAYSTRNRVTTDGRMSFKDWALAVFGKGICRHFMFPYNLKLWRHPLDKLGSDWCAPFVPRPLPGEVIAGAYMPQRKKFGYNACFRYPVNGGAHAIPDAFAKNLKNIFTGKTVVAADFKSKTLEVTGLGTVRYKTLVSTMTSENPAPLPLSPDSGRARSCI